MMSGAEAKRAAPLLSFADRGFGERNLANTSLRLDSGFNEESLGWFDIVDERRKTKLGYCVALELHPNKATSHAYKDSSL